MVGVCDKKKKKSALYVGSAWSTSWGKELKLYVSSCSSFYSCLNWCSVSLRKATPIFFLVFVLQKVALLSPSLYFYSSFCMLCTREQASAQSTSYSKPRLLHFSFASNCPALTQLLSNAFTWKNTHNKKKYLRACVLGHFFSLWCFPIQ